MTLCSMLTRRLPTTGFASMGWAIAGEVEVRTLRERNFAFYKFLVEFIYTVIKIRFN